MKRALAILTLLMLGCSQQYREVDFEVDAAEMDTVFTTVSTSSTDSRMSDASQIYADTGTWIFFADAPGDFGPVASVASLYNFDFLGQGSFGYEALESVTVFVLANSNTGRAALVFSYQFFGDATTHTNAFTGSFSISGKKFSATLESSTGSTIVLESFDTTDGEFNNVVQMKVLVPDANGELLQNGQFSTLLTFAP